MPTLHGFCGIRLQGLCLYLQGLRVSRDFSTAATGVNPFLYTILVDGIYHGNHISHKNHSSDNEIIRVNP